MNKRGAQVISILAISAIVLSLAAVLAAVNSNNVASYTNHALTAFVAKGNTPYTGNDNVTHNECIDNQCINIQGAGKNECSHPGSNCGAPQFHLECINNQCVSIQGGGNNESGCVIESTPCGSFNLAVAVTPSNSGSITSSPIGISCPNDCQQSYPSGTVVTLTANPNSGYSFNAWSGTACSGANPVCVTTMNANKYATANFTQNGTGSLADLDIVSLTAESTFNQSVYTVLLTAVIKNIGLANAGSSTTRFYGSIGVDKYWFIPSIPAGQTRTAYAEYVNIQVGNYSATAIADWFNNVTESNEGNNYDSVIFNVP